MNVGKRMFRHLKDVKKTLLEVKKIKKSEEKIKEEEERKNLEQKKIKQPRKKRRTTSEPSTPAPPKTTELTGKVMKEVSTYYGLAIQRYPDSIEEMEREIWATFYHKISTGKNPQHDKCNIEWCGYLQAQANNTVYEHKPALSPLVEAYVKPVFEKLTDHELLKRCLGKNTQNSNECYNKTLWSVVQKHTFAGKELTELAVQITLAVFNEGQMTILKILEVMGCTIGWNSYNFASKKNYERIYCAERHAKASAKEARSSKKEDQQNKEESYQQSGNLLYGPGIAD